jgi:hypothetical protein
MNKCLDRSKRQIEPIEWEGRGFGLPTWDGLEEGRGDLAERPGGEEGEREEAAVGDARGAAADAADRRPAGLARARRAARRQARRRPHGCGWWRVEPTTTPGRRSNSKPAAADLGISSEVGRILGERVLGEGTERRGEEGVGKGGRWIRS